MNYAKRKGRKALFAIVLAAAVVMSAFSALTLSADGAEWKTTAADSETLAHWSYTFEQEGSHELPASSENIGRIWVDKSVFTGDAEVPLGNTPVAKTEGADFLIGLSALSSASSELITDSVPMDIVLVLDVSGSMNDELTSTTNYTEIYNNLSTRSSYYIRVNDSWTEVKYNSMGQKGWRYWSGWNYTYVTPKTGADDETAGSVQFYTRNILKETKMDALKSAVNNFLDSTAVQNGEITDDAKKHRVSLVKFASDKTDTVGNDKDKDGYNYSQIVSGLTTDIAGLKTTVNGFDAAGATSADYGMEHATAVLDGARENSKKVVIFFTDGEPNHSNGFSETVANNAINGAKSLKDGGATVYTVGIFEGANPDASVSSASNFNRYMHGMSSNYPAATGYRAAALGARAENSDYYKAASNSAELSSIFDEISSELAQPTPPTQIESGQAATTGGYITFTDTLGDYMEVRDLNGIFLDGKLYEQREVQQTAENVKTYVYTDTVNNAIFGEQSLSSIVIRVTEGVDEKAGDTVTVRIPAALIPVRYYDIENNEAAGTLNMTIDDARPIRVFYSVGIKESAEKKLLSGNITDTALLNYLNENTGADGRSCFYANKFTPGKSTGDTVATFAPAATNPFYFYTEDTPLYSDEKCTVRALEVADGASLYYKNTYYENKDGLTSRVFKPIAISSAGDLSGIAKEEGTGYLYMPKGTARVNRMAGFTESKGENITGTAESVISPTWDGINREVDVYLGNNGLLTAELPGNLAVSKTVTADEGLTAPDKDFEFTVTLTDEGGSPLTETYEYAVTDKEGNPVNNALGMQVTGKIENGSGKITLKDAQTAIIAGLPDGAKYTVTETAVAGFTAVSTGEKGNIEGGKTADAAFSNNYSVEPVTLTGADNIKAQKVLKGRQWNATDSFTFAMSPVSYQAPREKAADATAEILEAMPKPDALNLTVTDGAVQSFGDIEFTKPGIYSYAIAEILPDDGGLPGVRYSKSVYRIIVTVEDKEDGTMSVSSEMKKTFDDNRGDLSGNWENIGDKTAVFTNTYYADAQPARIIVAKNYTDNSGSRPLEQNMFYFRLKAITEGAPMPEGMTPDENGCVKVGNSLFSPEYGDVRAVFPAIMFNSNDHDGKTYEYELAEEIPAGADETNGYTMKGMTYDPVVYKVKIEVNAAGSRLEVNTTYLDADGNPIASPRPEFNNSYAPTPVKLAADTALKGSKTLTGRDMKDGEIFDFTLALTGTLPAGMTDGVEIAEKGDMASVSGGKDGVAEEFSFEDITFKKPGQYTFSIKENVPAENPKDGVNYDGHECIATVTVADDNGVLKVTDIAYNNGAGAEDNSRAVFKNTYESKAVTLGGIQVEKVLQGREWKTTDRFFFNLVNKDKAPAPAVKRLNIVSTEKVTEGNEEHYRDNFGAITYTKAGVYTYEIYEDTNNLEGQLDPLPGIAYDKRTATAVVTVSDDLMGSLYVEKVVYDGDETVEAAVFTNVYKAEEISLTGEDALHGFKTLSGRDWTDGDKFDFELSAADDETAAAMEAGKVEANTRASADKKSDGEFSFGNMTFKEAGTYNFSIREKIPEVADREENMTYDGHSCTVTIAVTDNTDSGKLTATVTYSDGGAASFTNIAASNSKTVDAGDGRLVGADQKLTYTINWVNNAVGKNGAPAAATVTVTDKIPSGTYYVEDSVTGGGVYDPETRTITWTVEAKAAESGEVSFAVRINPEAVTTDPISNTARVEIGDNSYSTNTVTNPVAKKTVETAEGSDAKSAQVGDILTYTVSYTNTEGAPAVVNITDILPAELDYVTDSADNGGIYNPNTHRIAWEIADVPAGGSGTVSFKARVNENAMGKTVENKAQVGNTVTNTTATVVAGSGELTISKTVELTAGQNTKIDENKEFSFTVTLLDTGKTPLGGSYSYTVNGNEAGTVKSGDAITLKHGQKAVISGLPIGTGYSVTEAEEPGYRAENLSVSGTVSADGAAADFKNIYSVTPVTAAKIEALKTMTRFGEKTDLGDRVFGFKLEGGELSAPLTAENKSDGRVAFENIRISTAGVHSFTLSEVNGGISGIKYDDRVYTAEIEVRDNGEGMLETVRTTYYLNGKALADGKLPEFVNDYEADFDGGAATIRIKADKILTGRDMKDGEFSFSVKDEKGKEVSTGSNGPDGIVTFSELGLKAESEEELKSLIGEHWYTVSENGRDGSGITYDRTVFKVKVTVSDDGAGNLTVSEPVYYAEDGVTQLEGISFKNSYSAKPAEVIIQGNKLLLGRQMKAGEFNFLLSEDGKVIGEASNDADGKIGFAMSYAEAGKYVYTISEAKGDDEQITYSDAAYTVTVEVTDDGTGQLKANVIYPKDGAVFTNSYNEPVPPQTEPSVPKTGEGSPMILLIAVMIISILSLFYFKSASNKNQQG